MALNSLAAKRLRVARAANVLEKFLGLPRRSSRLPPPLDMLIATILSQNTSDKNSHRAYTNLRTKFPSWTSVADAPVRQIRSAIRIGGMANQKAPRIQMVLRAVRGRYGSYRLEALRRKDNDLVIKELTALDGVGVKTAACVLVFSLGRDVFPVDTHVHRICNRLGLVEHSPTPEKTFEAMRTLIPKGKAYSFHTNLIRFGRRVCRSASPACEQCPLFDECRYPAKRRQRLAGRRQSSADYRFMLLDNVNR
jgi:endonuclease-3